MGVVRVRTRVTNRRPKSKRDNRLQGQVAIVTGANGCIGSVIAQDLSEAGACVACVGVELGPLRQLAASLAGASSRVAIRVDVRREASVRAMVRQVLEQFGQIDILINNAGVRGPAAPVTELRRQVWQEVLDTNLTGPFLCSRQCLPHMLRRHRGSIVNISSMAGRTAYPLRASYSASKWGLIGLTLTLAQECGTADVRVNAICPGPVQGSSMDEVIERRARALNISTDAVRQQFVRPAALGRMVTPSDVSQMVLFLCSEAARNITGQVLEVNAGFGLSPV